MYFPTSGVEVSPFIPPLVAFGISLFASMGGISGAFLLLPFQVSVLGYHNPSVSATNQLYNIVSIPSGVYQYIKEGRMVWPLALVIAVGTLPGVCIGILVRVIYLPNPKDFKLFAGSVLLYIGLRLIKSTIVPQPAKIAAAPKGHCSAENRVVVTEFSYSKITYVFHEDKYSCSTLALVALSLFIGVIGGAYGIGGGAIIAPFLISWFRLPIHTISGATLMGTFLTSFSAILFFLFLSFFFPSDSILPDWRLGLLFGVGGLLGMYCGARAQKYIPQLYIKWMLTLTLIGTAIKYYREFFFGS